jgi:hypothetical protein
LAQIFAGKGVVLLNSSVTSPSQPGSNGVTLMMMPQRQLSGHRHHFRNGDNWVES